MAADKRRVHYVDTLLMLDLLEAEEAEQTLKVLVEGQLRLHCPSIEYLVAACSPGSVAEQFEDMTREVDERALEALNVDASIQRGIVTCAYVAVRSLHFKIPKLETYELGTLVMVYRTREKIVRRMAMPDFDEETPPAVRRLFAETILETVPKLPEAEATPEENAVSNKIAEAVIYAFRDFALYIGQLQRA